MAPLPHYLVPEVVAHLTDTETKFLLTSRSLSKRDIVWDELVLSVSLYHYVTRRHMGSKAVLAAMLKTAPYEVFILPTITRRFRTDKSFYPSAILQLIHLHRPIPILEYMLKILRYSCLHFDVDEFCDNAASHNNIEALEWLRDPTTSDGRYPWTHWTCASAAAYGRIDMLERLRDPRFDGGVCPWGQTVCAEAAIAGQLEALIWLRNPDKGGGVCPWHKASCLSNARIYDHPVVIEWIMTQPDENWN
jgi:hypothetical protein